MKQLTVFAAFFLIFFLYAIEIYSSSVAHAQSHILPKVAESPMPATSTPSTVEATTSAAYIDSTRFEQQLSDHRAALAKKTQDRVYNLLQNIIGRMDAVVFRFNNIAYRIETRASLMTKEGKPTGDAQIHLDKAHVALANSTRILASDLGAFARAENPQEKFVNVQVQIKESNAYLHDAQSELRAALNALTQNPTSVATSTATSSRPQ